MGAISALASGPAKRWTALISGGAYAFLAVVVLLLRPWVGPTAESCAGDDLHAAVCDLADLADGGPLALTALGVLAVVVATGLSLVVAALAVPLLQLLAGTSLPAHGALVAPLVRLALRRRYVVKRRLTALAETEGPDGSDGADRSDGARGAGEAGPPTARPAAGAPPTPLAAARRAQAATRVARARRRLHRLPVHDDLMLPTRIGNSFAAMNGRVRGRHGIDPSLGWPLLEQLFDDAARHRLEQGSDQVLSRARNLLWAVLTVLVCLAISFLDRVHGLPAGIVAVAGCVIALLLLVGLGDSVDAYTDTVEAAVLRHHDALYEAAGWPLPADTEAARRTGAEFTAYLNRVDGARPEVTFERPPPPAEPSPLSPRPSPRQEGTAQ
ncbi:hypothetical protein SSPS47_11630 [Streptomyces sp. S4.7]|uniref:hypothetical protein n=1 Tax=Streptomyces sp. S4.7 TaxID=2705439 RepID=UPI00139840D3|nr:hypothetical protein [Streptomyces sp. S4.7]QHY95769.1 hypothetical protein SSPS47_11630 [Streptomyces sp. S4.7]